MGMIYEKTILVNMNKKDSEKENGYFMDSNGVKIIIVTQSGPPPALSFHVNFSFFCLYSSAFFRLPSLHGGVGLSHHDVVFNLTLQVTEETAWLSLTCKSKFLREVV